MMRHTALILAAALSLAASAREAWVPDLGNGRYRNPVVHADYSDPDVVRTPPHILITYFFPTTSGGLEGRLNLY